MKVQDKIFIVPGKNARLRTKNRIREHGASGFEIRQLPKPVQCFNGALGISLESSDGWFGWIRWNEIEIVDR